MVPPGRRRVSPRALKRLLLLLLLFCAALPYTNSLHNGFVWDDNMQQVYESPAHISFSDLMLKKSWRVLSDQGEDNAREISTYRPLLILSFALDSRIWNSRPFGYHLTNLGLFLLLVAFLFIGATELGARPAVAFLAVLFWAAQPALSESVSWISGRHDLLLGLFLAASMFTLARGARRRGAARRAWLALGLTAYLFALLSKEPAVVLPAVLAVAFSDVRHFSAGGHRRLGVLALWFAMALVYLAFRKAVVAQGNLVGGTAGVAAFLQTTPYAALKYLGYFFYLPHMTSHYVQSPVLAFTLRQFWTPALIHLALILAAVTVRRRFPGLLTGLATFYAFLLPSLVIIANDPKYAHRFLFLSSLGLISGLAALLVRIRPRLSNAGQHLIVAGALLVSTVNAARVYLRNPDYKSDETFFQSIVRDVPGSPVGYCGLADAYLHQGRPDLAYPLYQAALRRQPDYMKARNNLVFLLLRTGRLTEGEELARQALAYRPDYDKMNYNLAEILIARGKEREATRYLQRALEINPSYVKARQRLAAIAGPDDRGEGR